MMRLTWIQVQLFFIISVANAQYSEKYVATGTERINGKIYSVLRMNMIDNRVKVKYIADKTTSGKSVYDRYRDWSRHKSIIGVCSGTYVDAMSRPTGVCIDDGFVVNYVKRDDMDALVVVYKDGNVVVSDLDEGIVHLQTAAGPILKLDLRNSFDLNLFFSWARENDATVFQTHLMYYKGNIRISDKSSSRLRERRMMAAVRDGKGGLNYYIFNFPDQSGLTLYDNTLKISQYLSDYFIEYIINLEVGAKDVFEVRKPNGDVISDANFRGKRALNDAENLLIFYYE